MTLRQRMWDSMGLFGAVYGFTPAQVRALKVGEFNQLESEAGEWLKLKAGLVGGEG